MSEAKRDISAVQADYSRAALELGDVAYRIEALLEEINKLEGRREKIVNNMRNLNREAIAKQEADVLAQAAEKEAQASVDLGSQVGDANESQS